MENEELHHILILYYACILSDLHVAYLDITLIIPLHVQIGVVPLQERRIQQTLLLFISAQQYYRPAIRLPIA